MKLKLILASSIGKKYLVAITGLGLSGFVLTHLLGNFLLFVGPEAYNTYSHKLVSNPLIYLAEAGLLGIFVLHLFLAIQLTHANRTARGITPSERSATKGASFAARSMILTGLLVLVFVVLHLKTFKFGPHYPVEYGGVAMRDIYRLVVEKFQDAGYVAWYVAALVILGIHLSHGFAGAFQSLGGASSREKCLRQMGYGFAALISVGFLTQPLYFFFCGAPK